MSTTETQPTLLERPHKPDQVVECRVAALVGLEFRDAGDDPSSTGTGEMTLAGHAAVFDKLSLPLYDWMYGEYQEKVARGAFERVLSSNPDVHLVVAHDMAKVLARTQSKTLELREDPAGLRVFARVDPGLTFANDLRIQMKRHDVDQMSFAFTVADESWLIENEGQPDQRVTRTILEIGELFDVSVVAQGAYPQTDASLRNLLERAAQRGRVAQRTNDLPRRDDPSSSGEQQQDPGRDDPSSSGQSPSARHRRARHMRQRLALTATSGSTRDAFATLPPNPDADEPNESLGEDVAEAIEALTDLLADGYDLSMPADTAAGTTVRDELVECIGYLAGVLTEPMTGSQAA